MLPVRHVSPNEATPVAPGTFEGVLTFVIDVGQVIHTFARTTEATAAADVLTLEDAQGETIVRLGADGTAADPGLSGAGEGMVVTTDAAGDGLALAWSSLSAAGERWVVRIETPLAEIAPD
ncbi:MAG: hypothetical protein ACLGHP_00910, partial [Vicinamibacteria bacterium]